MSKTKETYCGDGVYATFDGWYLTLDLRAQDGGKIALEPNVLAAVLRFVANSKRELAAEASDGN